MKDLKFVSSDILVSFLRPFFKVKKKQTVYPLFTMLVNSFIGEK